MPAREINPFTALTRIRSQFLRTQWSTSNHQRVDMTTPLTAQPSGLADKWRWKLVSNRKYFQPWKGSQLSNNWSKFIMFMSWFYGWPLQNYEYYGLYIMNQTYFHQFIICYKAFPTGNALSRSGFVKIFFFFRRQGFRTITFDRQGLRIISEFWPVMGHGQMKKCIVFRPRANPRWGRGVPQTAQNLPLQILFCISGPQEHFSKKIKNFVVKKNSGGWFWIMHSLRSRIIQNHPPSCLFKFSMMHS